MSSVARVTEISAESETSFEDAIRVGIDRAAARRNSAELLDHLPQVAG